MKSINQHYRNINIKSKIEAVLLISLFIIPLIVTCVVVKWLDPISFWQQMATLIISPVLYIVTFILYFLVVDFIHDTVL